MPKSKDPEYGDELTPSEVPTKSEEQEFVEGSPQTGTKETVKAVDPVSKMDDDPEDNPSVAETRYVEEREAEAREAAEAAEKAAAKEARKKG